VGKGREDYFELVPCQPFYRIFNHQGRCFDCNDNADFTLSQIERWSPADKERKLWKDT
jgi:phytoene desaturase